MPDAEKSLRHGSRRQAAVIVDTMTNSGVVIT